ncbi:4Fe-4S binding protein [Clostridium sp. FS41]|uniref:ATP-binding protein n=1 Tax=Clostridia TaxID=186801 RepID=UPI0009E56E0F|nr:4Fe-4S binding protein [Clostridium sp. FS41]
MKGRKKALLNSKECVACGCCTKSCPLNAMSIYKGMYALLDEKKCVGCGRCEAACPAQVISIVLKEAAAC